VVSTTGTAIAPFLLVMGRDLQSDVAAVARLIALLSLSWGAMSLVAGAASDRVGRRAILVGATVLLAVARLGLATAARYGEAVAWQLLCGLGGGAYMGTVFAAVADHLPPAQRGRALGWVMTGQSFSLVVGIPLLTYVAAFVGWRGATVAHGAALLLVAALVWVALPPSPRGPHPAPGHAVAIRSVATPQVLALLGAGTMERVCFVSGAVYLATYLIESYGVPMAALAGSLAVVALGNLAGNVLGGQIADRTRARPLAYAVSSVVTGALSLPLLTWQPGLTGSIALGFAYSLVNSLGRVPLMAALSEVPAEIRGAVLGLNIAVGSLGWIGASALGGWLLARWGFGSLGLLCAAAGLAGAGLGVAAWLATRGAGRA
jgi:DHA1 family inner membrane transport protein